MDSFETKTFNLATDCYKIRQTKIKLGIDEDTLPDEEHIKDVVDRYTAARDAVLDAARQHGHNSQEVMDAQTSYSGALNEKHLFWTFPGYTSENEEYYSQSDASDGDEDGANTTTHEGDEDDSDEDYVPDKMASSQTDSKIDRHSVEDLMKKKPKHYGGYIKVLSTLYRYRDMDTTYKPEPLADGATKPANEKMDVNGKPWNICLDFKDISEYLVSSVVPISSIYRANYW